MCVCCDSLLHPKEGEQGLVRLLVEADDTVPVVGLLPLLVEAVQGEEGRVEAGQEHGQQQAGAAHHTARGGGGEFPERQEWGGRTREVWNRIIYTRLLVRYICLSHHPNLTHSFPPSHPALDLVGVNEGRTLNS